MRAAKLVRDVFVATSSELPLPKTKADQTGSYVFFQNWGRDGLARTDSPFQHLSAALCHLAFATGDSCSILAHSWARPAQHSAKLNRDHK